MMREQTALALFGLGRRDPAIIVSLNRQLAHFASQRRLEFVDYHRALIDASGLLDDTFSTDGVHPNATGYARMRSALSPCLRRLGFNLLHNQAGSQ